MHPVEGAHFWIIQRCIRGIGDPGRGSEIMVGVSAGNGCGARSSAHAVAGSEYDGRAGGQPTFFSNRGRQFADYRGRGHQIREQGRIQLRRLQDFIGPRERRKIQRVRAGCVRIIRNKPAGQLTDEVVLRLKRAVNSGEGIRFVITNPHQLLDAVAGACSMPVIL